MYLCRPLVDFKIVLHKRDEGFCGNGEGVVRSFNKGERPAVNIQCLTINLKA